MKPRHLQFSRANTAVEYLLLAAVVGMVVFFSFSRLLWNPDPSKASVGKSSEEYYNAVTDVIMGKKPQAIDGHWCVPECPKQAGKGNNKMYKVCECPAPAFGGQYCTGDDYITCGNQSP